MLFTAFYNFSFFKNIVEVYPLANSANIPFIISAAIFLSLFISLFFSILASRFTTKALLILSLIISSTTAYFMDTYNVVINDDMIQNIAQTNVNESIELLSLRLGFYLFCLGILPAFIIYKLPLKYEKTLSTKLKVMLLYSVLIVGIFFAFSKTYTSFFREHKPLRYYTNPTYWIYSTGKFTHSIFNVTPSSIKEIATTIKLEKRPKKSLVIMVVGEAARGERFSLNGYSKKTNPLLEKENLVNFSKMYSCGTSTAISVPCMFSFYTKNDYSDKKARYTQNVLDILKKAGVKVLWRDNNSDSKGVALRVGYENFKTPSKNKVCDTECRDIGMLKNLDKTIQKDKNNLIILHQMGNHGPAYYKRYPKEFEKFTPVCKSNQFEKCTKEEVSNAYDNAILYTDFFLSNAINFLKNYKDTFDVSLVYISDHGESLGENGLYLHGLPYIMAPDEQIRVGAFMWFGDENITKRLKKFENKKLSQDYLFSTLLGLFGVKSNVYDKNLDILELQ